MAACCCLLDTAGVVGVLCQRKREKVVRSGLWTPGNVPDCRNVAKLAGSASVCVMKKALTNSLKS